MFTPKNIASSQLQWGYWKFTRPHCASDLPLLEDILGKSAVNTNLLAFGKQGFTVFLHKQDFENAYPGFISAYEMLVSLGCDSFFVTSVLKYAISHGGGESLLTFLEDSQVSPLIKASILTGLTGDEFISALPLNVPRTHSTSPPDDFL